MTHTYMDETLDFNVIYKKRKTLGIYIDIYGNVELRVPIHTTHQRILQLIEDKWLWIIKKVKESKERTSGYKEKVYTHGEAFLYLGQSYPIHIHCEVQIAKEYVDFKNGILHVYVNDNQDSYIKQALKRFYYQQCKAIVERQIRHYQQHFKIKPRQIKISDNKSQWGSCNSNRQLTFNWKLAMAPLEVMDYVVVHEMCHLIHLNHDRSFWRLVGRILPDYEERQNWLKQSSWKMIV